jgi:hypothetical protein
MTGQYFSYLNPKCDSGPFREKGGCGVFARQPIQKGELVSLWGGRIVTEVELDRDMQDFTQRILQIEEGFYLETPSLLEPADCFNHSCDPNIGFTGQIGLRAMRDIEAGEELNFDYAMCDGSAYDEFDCYCGAEHCRGLLPAGLKKPELWENMTVLSAVPGDRIARLLTLRGMVDILIYAMSIAHRRTAGTNRPCCCFSVQSNE